MPPVNFPFRSVNRSLADVSFSPLGDPHGAAKPPAMPGTPYLDGGDVAQPKSTLMNPELAEMTRRLHAQQLGTQRHSPAEAFAARMATAQAFHDQAQNFAEGTTRRADLIAAFTRELDICEKIQPFKRDLSLADLDTRIGELRNAAAAELPADEYLAHKVHSLERSTAESGLPRHSRAFHARRAAADADAAHIERMQLFADEPNITRMLAYEIGHRDRFARAFDVALPQPPVYDHPLGLVYHAPEIDQRPLHMMQLAPEVDVDCGFYAYNSIAEATGRQTMSKLEFHAVRDGWRARHLQESGESAFAESVDAFTGLEELNSMLARVPDAEKFDATKRAEVEAAARTKITPITDPVGVLVPADVSRSANATRINTIKASALAKAKAVALLAGSHWTNLQAYVDEAGRTVWHHVDSRNGRSQDIAYPVEDAESALKLHLQATLAQKGKRVDSMSELARHVQGMITIE